MKVKTAEESGLPMNIRPDTVARFGLGGLLTGGAAASALNLVHMIKEMSRRREEAQGPTETDESTLVLTLPQQKTASKRRPWSGRAQGSTPHKDSYITDGNVGDYNASDPPASEGKVNPEDGITNADSDPTKIKKVEGPNETSTVSKKRRQVRYPSGSYGIKTANWPTLTAALLASGAGGALGYRLVDKVFEVKRIKNKEKELEGARQEYLDMLAGDKTASLDELFAVPMDKEAQRRNFGVIDMPLGIAALAFLLGSGGSAYITKRILDNMEAGGAPKIKKPAVKRIVFRTSETPAEGDTDVEELKAAQAADEVFDAALGVYLDICSGEPKVLGNEKVAQALSQAGLSPAGIIPQNSTDFDRLLMTLEANPKLRQLMQGAMLDTHPIAKHFKWAFKLPGLSNIADQSLYRQVHKAFKPGEKAAEDQKFQDLCKEAGIFGPSFADVAASFYGSTLAEKIKGEQPEAEQEAPEEESDPEVRARSILGDLQISADDPSAAQFVLKNKKKIAMILQRLAEEGKI
jgi:hypothetical protein